MRIVPKKGSCPTRVIPIFLYLILCMGSPTRVPAATGHPSGNAAMFPALPALTPLGPQPCPRAFLPDSPSRQSRCLSGIPISVRVPASPLRAHLVPDFPTPAPEAPSNRPPRARAQRTPGRRARRSRPRGLHGALCARAPLAASPRLDRKSVV